MMKERTKKKMIKYKKAVTKIIKEKKSKKNQSKIDDANSSDNSSNDEENKEKLVSVSRRIKLLCPICELCKVATNNFNLIEHINRMSHPLKNAFGGFLIHSLCKYKTMTQEIYAMLETNNLGEANLDKDLCRSRELWRFIAETESFQLMISMINAMEKNKINSYFIVMYWYNYAIENKKKQVRLLFI